MKNLILFFALIMLSCSDNNKSPIYDRMNNILIEEYEMSARDLDLKIISLDNVGKYTAKDSISEYLANIDLDISMKKHFEKYILDKTEMDRFARKNEIEYDEGIAKFESTIAGIENDIKKDRRRIDSLNSNKEQIFGDSIILTISVIKNPFEGKVKRTTRFNIILGNNGLDILNYEEFDYMFYNYFEETLNQE